MSVKEILENAQMSDQTEYPTASYALNFYRAMENALFPHILTEEAQDPANNISLELLLRVFARLRRNFSTIKIDLVYSDLTDPDSTRMKQHVGQFNKYAQFRKKILNDPESIATKCVAELEKMDKLEALKQQLQAKYDELDQQLEPDRQEYARLQAENASRRAELDEGYRECQALHSQLKALLSSTAEKKEELEALNKSIARLEQDIATLEPHINQDSGSVETARDQVDALRQSIAQSKAELDKYHKERQELLAKEKQFRAIKELVPRYQDLLNEYKECQKAVEDATAERRQAQDEFDDKKRAVESTKSAIHRIEEKLKASESRKKKLEAEIEQKKQLQKAQDEKIRAEDAELATQISEMRVKHVKLLEQRDSQLNYNKQLEKMLESVPGELNAAEKRLDETLNRIKRVKLAPPA